MLRLLALIFSIAGTAAAAVYVSNITMDNSVPAPAFTRLWTAEGGSHGTLGKPTNQVSPDARSGQWQSFEKGFIFANPGITGGKVYAVTGAFADLWTYHGREAGGLGYPIRAAGADIKGGREQLFERGYLVQTISDEPHAVTEPIATYWQSHGKQSGALGYPTSEATICPGTTAYSYQSFQGGVAIVDNAGSVTVNPTVPCPLPSPTHPVDQIYVNQRLASNQKLISKNGRFVAVLQEDGNFVVYRVDAGQPQPLWASNTAGQPVRFILMQDDGNLVAYSIAAASYWSSGPTGTTNCYVIMQNDGNLVVYNTHNRPLWASNTALDELR